MRTSVAFATACGLALSGAIKLFLASGPAEAQSDQNLVWCKGEDKASPQQQINGCTALIQSGTSHGQELARYYFGRAVGYLQEHELDSAIKDLDAGLALDPENAVAFYNRAVGYEAKGDDRGCAERL